MLRLTNDVMETGGGGGRIQKMEGGKEGGGKGSEGRRKERRTGCGEMEGRRWD